jgi:uncharacterized protein
MKLAGDTALITGSSGGIGEEFAVALAQQGVNLVLVARREDKLTELRERLLARHPGLTVDVIAADLSQPGSGKVLADDIAARGRRIDVLINNAGVGAHGTFADTDPDETAAQIQLNVGTLVDLTARLLPAMVTARHGLVINVASTAAFQPTPSMAVYGATKAFVLSFTEALWYETRKTGVRVFALCPGATETEFFERTGEQFMTRGRQTPQQVVQTALGALDKSSPTVVSGLVNTLLANGYRVAPRSVLAGVSDWMLKAGR